MLDKIVNINSNFQFKGGGSHSAGFDKIFHGGVTSRLNPNDSIMFSPLAQYLSRINWQLKALSYISKTKMHLDFLFDGFEFSAEIDLLDYFKDNRQTYNIYRTIESGLYTSKILLRISSRKGKLVLTDNPDHITLKALFRLFEKASVIQDDSDEFRNTLQEGIRTELQNEFGFINVIIYNIINKVGTIKIPENVLFHDDDAEPVRIEKITILHDKRLSE